ncbi:hypothetical protein ENSA7_66350 [Enhygromyxa salina]|uniref:Uncharacterized protein n=1 Tax=Enhygromyxa salina TaxID=215803 RepID=A0A2S9XYK8_9BACT|nr:hypothetical protein ENSA7_66350 [Enhygromyxa salina]
MAASWATSAPSRSSGSRTAGVAASSSPSPKRATSWACDSDASVCRSILSLSVRGKLCTRTSESGIM